MHSTLALTHSDHGKGQAAKAVEITFQCHEDAGEGIRTYENVKKKKKKKLIVIHEYANRYISYCLASTLRITKVIKLLQLKTY